MSYRVLAAVAAVVLLDAGRAGAQAYHDQSLHFSAYLPPGWRPMRPAEVERFNTPGAKMPYLSGFRRAGNEPAGSYPYGLVCYDPDRADDLSCKEVADAVDDELPDDARLVSGELDEIVAALPFEVIGYDRGRRQFIQRTCDRDAAGREYEVVS